MIVIEIWTGKHASALRAALRLTNESFARKLGTATRTIAKWNAEPDVVPIAEMQRALDTLLERSPQDARERFGSMVAGSVQPPLTSDTSAAELRLAHDATVSQLLSWLDERAAWPTGRARQRVATQLCRLDGRQLQDRAHKRSKIDRRTIAQALLEYYQPRADGYWQYSASCGGEGILTSVLTRTEWLDLRLPLGTGLDDLAISWDSSAEDPGLTEVCANAAIQRVAEVLATSTQIVNSPLYRLVDVEPSAVRLSGRLALTDFNSYALTMDCSRANSSTRWPTHVHWGQEPCRFVITTCRPCAQW